MTDPQTLALINRLERAYRRWKSLAIGAMAALVLVLLIAGVSAVFQWQQIRTEQERAEQAIQEAKDQREQVRKMFYYSRIALAEREASQRRDHKP
jgi:hypothetical protein